MDNAKGERQCTSRSRCENPRVCEYCARVRQSKIAGIAEQIEAEYGQLTLTVLKPEQNTAAALKAVHASFMRRALAPAGIWTVETGELFAGLHLNIISPKPAAARWKCESYSELLKTTARDAAAYIAKRKGMPLPEQYPGRLYGSWGQIGAMLASQEMPTIVQGAAIEASLNGKSYRDGVQIEAPAERMEQLTREQYREIAMRNLPRIREVARNEQS
jgi:hypothetical protein